MLCELLAQSREMELAMAERKVAYRMEYENGKRVERLEKALAVARSRVATIPVRAA
jgi:hypothetical protein